MTAPQLPSIFSDVLPFVVYGPRDNAHLNRLDSEGVVHATRPASPEEFDMYVLMTDANSRVNLWMMDKVVEMSNMLERLSDYDILLQSAIHHAPDLALVPLEQRKVELKRLTGKVIGVTT